MESKNKWWNQPATWKPVGLNNKNKATTQTESWRGLSERFREVTTASFTREAKNRKRVVKAFKQRNHYKNLSKRRARESCSIAVGYFKTREMGLTWLAIILNID